MQYAIYDWRGELIMEITADSEGGAMEIAKHMLPEAVQAKPIGEFPPDSSER